MKFLWIYQEQQWSKPQLYTTFLTKTEAYENFKGHFSYRKFRISDILDGISELSQTKGNNNNG